MTDEIDIIKIDLTNDQMDQIRLVVFRALQDTLEKVFGIYQTSDQLALYILGSFIGEAMDIMVKDGLPDPKIRQAILQRFVESISSGILRVETNPDNYFIVREKTDD